MKNKLKPIGLFCLLLLLLGGARESDAQNTKEQYNWYERSVKMIDAYLDSKKKEEPKTKAVNLAEEPKGMIQRYETIYEFLNGATQSDYDSLKNAGLLVWDSAGDSVYVKYQSQNAHLDTNFQVFGWHPYWMGLSYKSYNYELLSTVAFYAYDIHPDNGTYNNPTVIADWKQTDLVDLAHASSCKVQLTITCHKTEDIRVFLDNKNNQQNNLIDSLLLLVRLKGADGINVNFELLPKGYARKFTTFIRALSNRFRWENKDYELTLTLPSNDYNKFFQVEKLEEYVDHFVLMAYDYHNPNSQSGAIAPMRGGRSNIEKSVSNYIRRVEQPTKGIDPRKLIVGLPYYGGIWKMNNDGTSTFEKHVTYRAIKDNFSKQKINYDFDAWSPYFTSSDQGQDYQCWFEDSTSLSRKYDWVKAHELGGVGIWALGYDNGYSGLWGAINEKFTTRDSLGRLSVIAEETTFFSMSKALSKYSTVTVVASLFLFVFIVIGFIAGLFHWQVRAVFFANYTYRLIYIIGVFIIFIGIILLYNLWNSTFTIENSIAVISICLLLGSWLTYWIHQQYKTYREELP